MSELGWHRFVIGYKNYRITLFSLFFPTTKVKIHSQLTSTHFPALCRDTRTEFWLVYCTAFACCDLPCFVENSDTFQVGLE